MTMAGGFPAFAVAGKTAILRESFKKVT